MPPKIGPNEGLVLIELDDEHDNQIWELPVDRDWWAKLNPDQRLEWMVKVRAELELTRCSEEHRRWRFPD
eukprot:s7109_g1.t1